MDRLAAIRHLYPFDSHYLSIGGQRLHYLDEGHGDCIVMLHGNPTWSFYYRELVKGLRDAYRVVVPDHMGCGLSEKPQDYPYTLEQHITNLERLVESLNIDGRVTLAMHDWGGAIGCGFAARHPDLVDKLAFFNTAAFQGRVPRRIRMCKVPILGALAVRGLNGFSRGALAMACKHRDRLTPDVRAGYLLPYDSYRYRVAVHRFIQDIPESPDHPTYASIEQIDRSLRLFRDRPAIVFWGLQDFCFTEHFLDGWIERFPGAVVHIFEDAGHYVVEDAHERIIPLLRQFLAQGQSTTDADFVATTPAAE
jgi:haloalkane dehalogenase